MSFVDEVKDRLKTTDVDPEVITPTLLLGVLYALEGRASSSGLGMNLGTLEVVVELEKEVRRGRHRE